MKRAHIYSVWLVALALCLGACAGSEGQRKVQEGNELLTTDDIDQALETYRAAQKIEPDLADAYYGEGLALYHLKRHAEAEPALRKAVDLEPEEQVYHVYLGRVLGRLDRFEDAEVVFREATRLEPIEPEGWKGLGLTLYNLGRRVEAREALVKYLSFARAASDRSAISQLVQSLPAPPPAPEG
jgi:Flp pilus assembly protein TadD